MNLDKNKFFPNQRIDGDSNECVPLTIVDICGNADGRLYDPDFTYAAQPRLLGLPPTNAGRDVQYTMAATIAYGLLPMSEETFTAKTMGDLYVANPANYTLQQNRDSLQYAPKGIVDLFSYDDIVGYLNKYQRGALLAIDWYESFNSPVNGALPEPQGARSGHCVAVYDEAPEGLLVKPWLGPNFGNGGYVTISRDVLSKVFDQAHGFDPNANRAISLLFVAAIRLPYLANYLPTILASLAKST
jgi:hypothetical protein